MDRLRWTQVSRNKYNWENDEFIKFKNLPFSSRFGVKFMKIIGEETHLNSPRPTNQRVNSSAEKSNKKPSSLDFNPIESHIL